MDWGKKWHVDFNAGITQLVSFDQSNNTGAIAGLQISIGHRTMTDRNKCLTDLKLFQSDIASERKIKT